jgi:glycosyltransferase involved in cell wall biosynthesis
MKVLFIHDCAGVALQLRKLLIKRGHKADLLFFGVGPNKGDPYLDYGDTQILTSKPNQTRIVFKKILDDYDIIHSYNTRFPNHPLPWDYLFMKALKKRVVIHFHGSDLRLFYRRLVTRVLLRNKVQIVPTPDLLAWAPDAYWLPNPVDPNVFRPMPSEPHKSFRILHSSTDWKIKRTDILIDVVGKLKSKGYDIKLKIVGRDGEPCKIADMPAWYCWCDCVVNEVVLPIHSLVGVEAMMCERPVLSSYKVPRHVSNPPIVDITPETLAREIVKLMSDPERRVELGRQGRVWALQHHDPERVCDKLLEIYENA